MADFLGLMKKAGELQAKMAAMQAELDQTLVEGASGGGMVKLTMTAKGALQSLSIDPSLLKAEDKEIVEDLLIAAHADARGKADVLMQEKMKDMAGGLPLPPGLKLF